MSELSKEPTRFFDCTLKRLKQFPVDSLFEEEYSKIIGEVEYILNDHEGLTILYRELNRERLK